MSVHILENTRLRGSLTTTGPDRKPTTTLADAYPEIAAQWHPDLNDRTPADIGPGSTFLATWHGCTADSRHVWTAPVRFRTERRSGCAVCVGKQIMPGVTDLASVRPDLASQWHPTLNDRRANEVSPGSHYVATWHNCPVDSRHIWTGQVNSRTKLNGPYGCSVCSGKQIMVGISDLATTHPELAAQWNYELNDKTPQQVGAGSSYKAYWSGCAIDPGHTWRTAVGNRTLHKTGCSVCAGQVVQPGFNDLATVHPGLASQWHPSKNHRPPSEYTGTSGIRVWWICPKGHEWRSAIASRSTGARAGCPQCSLGSTSRIEIMVRSLIRASGMVDVLSDKPVYLPVPWADKKRISVDVLGKVGEQAVVVEYDGSYFHRSEEVRAKDEAKTLALLEAGYVVVRLRENKLPFLEISHPRLFQTSFRYRAPDEKLATKQLVPVLQWIRGAAQLVAA